MDKAIRAGRLLMKRPDVVVPKDILLDVSSASEPATKTPPSGDPKAGSAQGDAPVLVHAMDSLIIFVVYLLNGVSNASWRKLF